MRTKSGWESARLPKKVTRRLRLTIRRKARVVCEISPDHKDLGWLPTQRQPSRPNFGLNCSEIVRNSAEFNGAAGEIIDGISCQRIAVTRFAYAADVNEVLA